MSVFFPSFLIIFTVLVFLSTCQFSVIFATCELNFYHMSVFFTMFLFSSPHVWLLYHPLPHFKFFTLYKFSSPLVSFPYNESISFIKSVFFTTCQFFSKCVSFFTTCQISLPRTSFTYSKPVSDTMCKFFHLASVFSVSIIHPMSVFFTCVNFIYQMCV
jgi:hypothetical protein